MKNAENDFFDLGGMKKQGYAYLIGNAGLIIAVITLVVATLVTFTDVEFSDFGSESFTTGLVIMLISSYLMYFSLEDVGEGEGEECEEYQAALKRYIAARKRITPDSIDALREFCVKYSERELEYRRKSYLGGLGYSLSEYGLYKSGKEYRGRALRAFRRADKMCAVKLTPALLLSQEAHGGKSELENPERGKIIGMLLRLIPSTVCTCFTVSVILTAKNGLTADSVIDGILKLSALPIIGFKGFQIGYRYVKDEKSVWIETKARVLELFLSRNPSCVQLNTEAETKNNILTQ